MSAIEAIFFVLLAIGVGLSLNKKTISLLLADKQKQHLSFGACAALTILWSINASIYSGLSIHFLWLTAATLILGPSIAILAGVLAFSINFLIAPTVTWYQFAIQAVSGVILPVGIAYLVYAYAYHHLPRHFFVYIFVCSFFTGALTIASKTGFTALIYWLNGQYDGDVLVDNYLILIPLIVFPEALINGMTMAIAVIYKPEWVRTFFDNDYLNGK